MEEKKLKIRDLTLRDGQQSLFATRLKQEDIDPLLPLYKDAGFYIMEVWGGAVGAPAQDFKSHRRQIASFGPFTRPQPLRLCTLPQFRA